MCSHVGCPTAHEIALGSPARRCPWAKKKGSQVQGSKQLGVVAVLAEAAPC